MSYRYIGNKTKLLDTLLLYIKKYSTEGSTIVDLMCGTASVSEMLKLNNYQVVSSDMMTYSTQHASVRLLANEEPTFSKLSLGSYSNVLTYLENIEPTEGVFFREYSPAGEPLNGASPRQYFTPENAKQIDSITNQINIWKSENKLSRLEESFLRHDLVLAANKVANIAGTYGHFRSKWNNSSLKKLKLQRTEIIPHENVNHTVIQGQAESIAKNITADLCYIDPPYMKRQYAANYHILETIARGDEPEAVGVSGLRPWRDQYSNFCSKRKIRDSFSKIITEMNCNKFLISYSEDGLLSKDELISLFSSFGSVECFEIDYQRFKSNQSKLSKNMKEYLFYIKK